MNIVNNKEYKAAIYIRLSREDGDKEESESVVNQRKILQAYAKENNYKVVDEYVDDGYTGTNFNRPSFQKMVSDIENKKINMVITKSLSRLGRDYIETGRFIEKFFPENDVRYIAVLDSVDTYLDSTCDTVAFKNIMNDYYAKETSKNIKRTKNKKRKEGFYYISYAPFGYKKISKSGEMEIDDSQAKVVQEIFDLFISGKGTYQIAEILTKRGIETPGIQMKMTRVLNNMTEITNMWECGTIRKILENQVYIGNTVQNKRKKISYKSKKVISLSKNEYIIGEKHHKPIISKEKWEITQQLLKNHKNQKVRENDVLFKGLLYCAHCNNKLAIRTKVNHNKIKEDTISKYISCNTASRKVSNKKCYSKYITYDIFEKAALSKISEILNTYLKSDAFNDEELLKKMLNSGSNRNDIINKIQRLKNDLADINKKVTTLYNDKINGLIEEQDYKLFSESFISERHRIEELIAETNKELEEYDDSELSNRIKEDMKEVIKSLSSKENFTKENLVQLINKIEIDKDRNAVIYFNFCELNCIGGGIKI